MLFISPIFLFWFLPGLLILYYLTPRWFKSPLLTLGSYLFYGWWRFDFLILIAFSTCVDYWCGNVLERSGASPPEDPATRSAWAKKRKSILLLSVGMNLGLLGYFKYANFGVESFNRILGSQGMDPVEWTKVILPVGISFYTFQTMSYTIDIFRGRVAAVRRFSDFACFVSLFPQLVAGPIVRYKDIADQLRRRAHSLGGFASGALRFQMGFAKKVLIADSVEPLVSQTFGMEPTSLEAWIGVFAYSLQIYFDFSGYSDMAVGLGRMFGFRFPENFDAPYRSRSITEFWQRWHISLGAWLRDYLYIPLGGNRRGAIRTGINLAITMLLGGLWHGAAWTFVAWGAWQGGWLMLERFIGKRPFYAFLPGRLRVLPTFAITLGGWVWFRSGSMDQAKFFLHRMFVDLQGGWSLDRLDFDRISLCGLVAGTLLLGFSPTSQQLAKTLPRLTRWGIPLAFVLAVVHTFFQAHSPFLYFQF